MQPGSNEAEEATRSLDATITRTVERMGAGPVDLDRTLTRTSAVGAVPVQLDADRMELVLGEVLGEGGMGSVRLACQSSLARNVAVKSLLEPEQTTQVALLLRESRVLGRLEHPNVVPVHGLAWDARSGPLLVMKRIEGVPWRSRIGPEGGLEQLEEHLNILMTVCQALHFAHARQVIHRDLKPSNVMVGAYGEVYVVDWGIAHLADEPLDGELLGTPAYMAPEMVRCGLIDRRTDVFLLGATLHHVLTGRPRHRGRDLQEVLRAALLAEPHVYPDAVPAPLGALCNQACAHDPAERPADAMAFREAIVAYLKRRGALAMVTEAGRRLAAATGGAAQATPHLVAARFGFEQALREWPDSEEAQRGRQACLRRHIEVELQAGNAPGAGRLLAELSPADDELTRRLGALRVRQQQQALALGRLDSLQRDLQLEGRTWGRSAVTLVSGVGSGLYILIGGEMVRRAGRDPSLGSLATFLGLGLLTTLVGLVVLRRQLLDNELYRRLMTAFALTHVLLAAGAYLGMRAGASFHQLLVGTTVVMAAFALLMATVVSPVFWATEVMALAAGWGAVTWPERASTCIATAWMLHTIWIAWALRPADASEAA